MKKNIKFIRTAKWYLGLSITKLNGLKRKITHQTNTWWDNQDYKMIRDVFLREGVDVGDGVEHPSRAYLRKWLTTHPHLTLLDIPSGVGVEYEGFLKYKTPVKYLGMDFSDTILRALHERFPHIKAKKGAIQKIPLIDSSQDIVLCRHILEHIPDYRHAVIEALRVSRRHVFLILFRKPTRSVRKEIGWGAWDNRLDIKEMQRFFKLLSVNVSIKTIPTMSKELEDNTVIHLTKKS